MTIRKDAVIGLLLFLMMASVAPGLGKGFVVGEGQAMEMYEPGQVEESPGGDIYVYDWKDWQIKVYAADGKFLRAIGKRGEGPGEIKRMGGFGFTRENKLFFVEFIGGHQWITILELDGKLVRTVKIDIGTRMFGALKAVCTADGGYLCTFTFDLKPEKYGDFFLLRAPMKLLKLDATGKMIAAIVETDHIERMSYIQDGADVQVPFSPAFEWGVLPDNSIVFSNGLDKNLKVFNDRGVMIKEIKTALPEARKVTGADLDKWRADYKKLLTGNPNNIQWYERFGDVIEKYKTSIYEKIPHLRGLSVTPAGHILVPVTDYLEEERQEYRLIGQDGTTLVKINVMPSGLKMTRGFLFSYREVDDERVLYCLVREKGEDDRALLLRYEKTVGAGKIDTK